MILALDPLDMSASSPPARATSNNSFYKLHPEYSDDNLQAVFASGVAAFQQLLDMTNQGTFASLESIRTSMDKADETGDGFDPPTQLKNIALVFGRLEGLIQEGRLPIP